MIYIFEVLYTERESIKRNYFWITTAKSREEAFRKVLDMALDFYVPDVVVSISLVRIEHS